MVIDEDDDVSHESLFQRGFGVTSLEKGLILGDVSRKCALEGSFGVTSNCGIQLS